MPTACQMFIFIYLFCTRKQMYCDSFATSGYYVTFGVLCSLCVRATAVATGKKKKKNPFPIPLSDSGNSMRFVFVYLVSAGKLQVVRKTSGTCWEIDANNGTIIKARIEGEGVTNPFTVCIHIKADISACLCSSKRKEFLAAGCAAFVV